MPAQAGDVRIGTAVRFVIERRPIAAGEIAIGRAGGHRQGQGEIARQTAAAGQRCGGGNGARSGDFVVERRPIG